MATRVDARNASSSRLAAPSAALAVRDAGDGASAKFSAFDGRCGGQAAGSRWAAVHTHRHATLARAPRWRAAARA